jgi:hypothetical protein
MARERPAHPRGRGAGMTAGQVVLIDCDAPGCTRWMTVSSVGGLDTARRQSSLEGWTDGFLPGIRGVVDFCPAHRGSLQVEHAIPYQRYVGNRRQYV